MKKRLFLVVLFALMLIGCKNEKNDEKLFNLKSLEVISSYNGYIFAVDEKNSEETTYAVYKEVDSGNYKKLYNVNISIDVARIDNTGKIGPKGLVLFKNDKLYIFCSGNDIISYYTDTGEKANKIEYAKILNNRKATLEEIIGQDDEYIYYKYVPYRISENETEIYYGKIDFELENVYEISENEIPTQLN